MLRWPRAQPGELAAFHLDRLVEAGLLETEFRRRSGRTGPGAGRPAKLYRRAARDFSVSLPAREYERAADLMATALQRLPGVGGSRCWPGPPVSGDKHRKRHDAWRDVVLVGSGFGRRSSRSCAARL